MSSLRDPIPSLFSPSAAEEERQRLSALFMQAPAAIAVYRGPQLVVEFINPLCRQILGPRPQVGRPLLEAMPEFAQTEAYQVIRRVATTGESITGNELRVPLDREGNGVLRDYYFNFTTQPLRDAQGNPDGVVAFAVEVTDQVLARQEMEKLANQVAAERGMLEQVIQQIPAAVFLAEAPSGRLLLGNPQVEELLGRPYYPAATVTEYAQYKGFHPDGRPYQPDEWPLARAVSQGEVVKSEPAQMVRGDGSRVDVEWSAAPVRGIDGRIVAGVVVGVDTTERSRMLRDEQRRSGQLKALASLALTINTATSLEQILAEVTEQARELVGAHQAVTSMTVNNNWAQAITAVSLSDKYAQWRNYDTPPNGTGIYALVAQMGRPMRMTQQELEAHPRFKHFGGEGSRHPPMRGWLAVPMVGRGGKNLGLIQLSDRYEGEFSAEDEAIIVQLAQLAGIAVENTRLREETQRAEERFRLLVEATTQVVWTTSPEGQVVEDSPSWLAFTGQTSEQWRGSGWVDAIHPEDRERAMAAWTHSMKTGERYEVEYRLRRKDGGWAHTLARGVPRRDAHGSICEWVGCNTDISEIRRAEQALRAQHQLIRTITDNATLGMLMMDDQQRCTFMNPAAEKLTGFRFEEVAALGKPLHDIIHHLKPDGSPYPIGECPIDRALPTRAREQGEDLFVHKNGHFYQVAFTASPILDEGRPLGTVIEVRDITAQKVAEREREQLITALEHSNQELDQFAYVASHDLKAPLRGIASLSQWIEEGLASAMTPQTHEHMRLLRGRVHRMEALIDGILDYSRAGRVRHGPERVDVGRLVSEVIELLSPGPDVRLEVAPELPVLTTERVPLQQVFMNLVGNALKHARRDNGALVRIGVRDAGEHYHFHIADNGQGIAPQYHERIWTIFQTLEARDKVEGTGIGLSVVKKIVESRGGRAWVESDVGQGATFHFTWPKRERERLGQVPDRVRS
jgi:PAS domain S-box-containing protein